MTDELFFADHMLGRLSKWLRMMGFDVKYPKVDVSDTDIIALCEKEGRILLTRDHELYTRYPRSILIKSGNFKDQAVQFISSFHPSEERYFTRCPECNGVLDKLDNPSEYLKIPETVRTRRMEVWECCQCGKVYWKGTHYDRILEQIRKFEEEIK